MVTSKLPRIDEFILIIEKRRKKLKCLINSIIFLTRITLYDFVAFVTKIFWVFISYAVHRNRLIDMFINNVNAVINKNLSLFFFRPILN